MISGTERILKDKENIEKFEYYKALSKDHRIEIILFMMIR